MHIPMTAIEFQDRFRTEEDCELAIMNLRWPNGFVCPNCGHDDAYHLEGRRLFQCIHCRHQSSITAGTIFHGTRVPLRNWFWMIYQVAHDKGGASAMRLAMQLGMYYKTVWHMLQKIRHAMGHRDEPITLSGLIELDEAIIGPHARKAGRVKKNEEGQAASKPRGKCRGRKPRAGLPRKTQTEVLVMVETEPNGAGYVAMNVLDVINRKTIEEVVDRKVDPSQHFKTDGCQSHYVLRSMGHSVTAKVCSGPTGCQWLPVVHQVIGLLKRFLIGTFHGVSSRYLPRYLQEFCFRFNRRPNQDSLCSSLLNACVCCLPMTYAELRL